MVLLWLSLRWGLRQSLRVRLLAVLHIGPRQLKSVNDGWR